ncbi:MAG TPA: NAD(P)-dependent alcohol dehydrogenase [Gemmatimonadales bacterium]|nr:NAD(P)-dependent alcohol dehydrogenase [Gemmatimonadales bacterium]
MEIRAYAIRGPGEPATPFTYQRTLGPHDVLVRLTHRTMTRGDTQFIDNDWGDTRFPLVPSHEMVGTVEQAGPDVAEPRAGERVGIGYQLGACFACSFCREGLEQFCPDQTVVGVNAYGGLGEHIVVDGRFAFRLPSPLDSARATPLMSSGLTVYSAILHARLSAGARVAVLGIGGLGRLALRLLRAMDHQVSAFSRSPEKRDLIGRLGAEYIDGSDPEALAALRATFDFILSTLNVPFDLDPYLTMLRPQGQLCFVASPLEPLSLRAGRLYDYGRRRIYGSYVGSRSDAAGMLEFAATHDVLPEVDVMPLTQVKEAIRRIRAREASTALVLESPDASSAR